MALKNELWGLSLDYVNGIMRNITSIAFASFAFISLLPVYSERRAPFGVYMTFGISVLSETELETYGIRGADGMNRTDYRILRVDAVDLDKVGRTWTSDSGFNDSRPEYKTDMESLRVLVARMRDQEMVEDIVKYMSYKPLMKDQIHFICDVDNKVCICNTRAKIESNGVSPEKIRIVWLKPIIFPSKWYM